MNSEADKLLRAEGWRIWSRPRQGENIWYRRGVTLPESKALAVIQRERNKREAEFQEAIDAA